MRKILSIPHKKQKSTCYINGLYDFVMWKGADYEYFLLPLIGGMAGFAYLNFKNANPQHMVFWGNRTKNLFNELEPILKYKQEISEGKSWKTTFVKIKESINRNVPVLTGALDMFFLTYNKEFYQKMHIPIHYILIVGYDDRIGEFYIHDCSFEQLQAIPYIDLKLAMEVEIPGMSKRNTIRTFLLREKLPNELEVAKEGFRNKARRIMNPSVAISGIPAMHKLAKKIYKWDNKECFEHMVSYAGLTPPLIPKNLKECNGLRFEQANILRKLGNRYGIKKWVMASGLFENSGEMIIELCRYALVQDKIRCSEKIIEIANLEEKGYQLILEAS